MTVELLTHSPNYFPQGSDSQSALVVVTSLEPGIFLMEWRNLPDNRLTPKFVNGAILPALDSIELAWRKSEKKEAAVITAGHLVQNRFYSNGLDIETAFKDPYYFEYTFKPLITRFLTFPMPCIAAVNGHAFAGGFMTALAHDFRVMKYLPSNGKGQAWGCMNEIAIGLALKRSMVTLVKEKMPTAFQKSCLEGHRFTAPELRDIGVVDKVVEVSQEDKNIGKKILAEAVKLANAKKGLAAKGTYGLIKNGLWQPIIDAFDSDFNYGTANDDQENRLRVLAKL